MPLVEIAPPAFDLDLDLRYATADNVTGRPIYAADAPAYLLPEAAELLGRAIALAQPLGYRFKIFDAFRPSEAQWRLWNTYPSDEFVADPRRGSPHSRGAAVDLTLLDSDGRELEMGTGFDSFTPQAHHARTDISLAAQRNRAVLLGIMSAAGWDFFKNEWWHYQLFNARARFPVFSDSALAKSMMAAR